MLSSCCKEELSLPFLNVHAYHITLKFRIESSNLVNAFVSNVSKRKDMCIILVNSSHFHDLYKFPTSHTVTVKCFKRYRNRAVFTLGRRIECGRAASVINELQHLLLLRCSLVCNRVFRTKNDTEWDLTLLTSKVRLLFFPAEISNFPLIPR